MRAGIHVANFTWQGGPAEMGPRLADLGTVSEDVGLTRLSFMDHLFQIGWIGAPELDMLEGYTALGFVAARTSTIRLLVTGVTYRHPGMLAKQVSTLDVLSGGRAWLGIGAAWNEQEHLGLGVPFPPLGERFERLEEAIQICLQMWSDDDGPFEGKHYQLAETLNVPQVVSRPHPELLIGGRGERKTLRLVARYARPRRSGTSSTSSAPTARPRARTTTPSRRRSPGPAPPSTRARSASASSTAWPSSPPRV